MDGTFVVHCRDHSGLHTNVGGFRTKMDSYTQCRQAHRSFAELTRNSKSTLAGSSDVPI